MGYPVPKGFVGSNPTPRTNTSSSGAVDINSTFMFSGSSAIEMVSVHEYGRRLENAKERIRSLLKSGFIH